ncbi:hypothetical protein DI487_10675 [Flavobacterium sediminis]|uniref:P pilus assembly/Cpx signaling pathway, periplasmic inhibitor/zinc-resistance associated protein n=2 Tax=Flavobacteriaceae TaxID=49546 RepID=A0A2U8QVP4_9FLAO|nr:hypothetical protein DI487_10675 [Flavobacterium sediminis]
MAILATGMVAFAQEREGRKGHDREQLTPEQRTELRVKKMTLDLDLNEKQQTEIKKLLTEQEAKRKAKMDEMKKLKETEAKPTADQRYEMQKERLDAQIDFKNKMKNILSKEQMQKWEEINAEREKMHKGERNKKMRKPSED